MSGFTELGIKAPLSGNLRRMGCRAPWPVQSRTIPPLLEGRDVIGLSQTGSGKTIAFLAPLIQRLLPERIGPRGKRPRRAARRRGPVLRVLVCCPTRELALQVAGEAKRLMRDTPLRAAAVYGKVGMRPQAREIAHGLDLLVGTPGRLRDLLRAGSLDLHTVGHVVIDEADRMLDMGFLPQIARLLEQVPRPRQTVLFTATMPVKIESLAHQFLDDPIRIEVDPHTTPVAHVEPRLIRVHNRDKVPLLLDRLADEGARAGTIVFCRTRRRAGWVGTALQRHGIPTGIVHGDRTQAQRVRTLARFEQGMLDVLVATDVVSRGLHLPAARLVVNYDVPNLPEDYVHRVGRAAHGTAGEGGRGEALTLLCRADEQAWGGIVDAVGVVVEAETIAMRGPEDPPSAKRQGERRKDGSDRREGERRPKFRRSKSAKRGAPSKRRSRQSRPIREGEKPGKGVVRRG